MTKKILYIHLNTLTRMEGQELHTAVLGLLSPFLQLHMQKHNQTTHSHFETWKVSCCKTLRQTTFLELKAKICYLQPQGKVIINNVWKNLTSTQREKWEKNDNFSKCSCKCFQDQKLNFRNARLHPTISYLRMRRLFAKQQHVQRWL